MAGGTFLSRFGSQSPPQNPNPNLGAGKRVPTQCREMQLAQHPWVLPPRQGDG